MCLIWTVVEVVVVVVVVVVVLLMAKSNERRAPTTTSSTACQLFSVGESYQRKARRQKEREVHQSSTKLRIVLGKLCNGVRTKNPTISGLSLSLSLSVWYLPSFFHPHLGTLVVVVVIESVEQPACCSPGPGRTDVRHQKILSLRG